MRDEGTYKKLGLNPLKSAISNMAFHPYPQGRKLPVLPEQQAMLMDLQCHSVYKAAVMEA